MTTEVYHKKKKTWIDWIVLLLVATVAGFIIKLSFSNTTKIAAGLSVNPYVLAGLIELGFAVLLFIRGRQRSTGKNVPLFVHVLYFSSLILVTIVNMIGLYKEDKFTGLIIAVSISGFMWGMEELLVWLWTKSDKPHRKTPREKLKEAKREIKEERIVQKIEWMRWESRKPDLKLIQKARQAEEKRRKIEADGLPEFFLREPEPPLQIEIEPVIKQPTEQGQIVPIKRPIGFHVEMSNTETPDAPTIEQRSNTPRSNTKKRKSSNTKTTKKEQAIRYVIGLIERDEDYSVTSVANTVGCARSTASLAIREAKEKMGV